MKLKNKKISSLDSMRGIAAIFVVLYHISWEYSLRDLNVIRGGYLMVDFFFVLSGFVISLSYKDKILSLINLKEFMCKRLFRLYPLHLFFLFIYFSYEVFKLFLYNFNPSLLSGVPFTGNNTPNSLMYNLLLIQGWGWLDYLSWNSPSWSISVELFSYFMFSIIVFFSRKYMILISTIIISLSSLYIINEHVDLNFNIDGGLFRCVLGFYVGVIVNYIYSTSTNYRDVVCKFSYIKTSLLQFLCLFLFFIVLYFHQYISYIDFLIIPISALLILVLPLNGTLNVFLSSRFFVFFGDISYSIYLSHLIVLTFVYTLIRLFIDANVVNNIIQVNDITGDAITILTISTIFSISVFTHRYIEMKFTKYLNQRFSTK